MRFWKLVTFPAFFLFILFGLTTIASAQEEGPEAIINNIMERFIEGETPSVVFGDLITPYQRRVIGAAYDSTLNTLDGQFAVAGIPIEYEKLKEQELSARIVYYKYVLYFDEQVYLFEFYFYNSPEGWLLNTWFFDSRAQSLK